MSDDSTQDAERDSRIGAVLSERYRVDSLIDTGAMGRVYAGEHVLMKKRVAIKVLHRELTIVPEFVKRFEREAMAAANIDNEHVVAATDFGKLEDGAVFLVLEFIDGRGLREAIDEGPMEAERALAIARQIAYALKSAHALGIVHRDLKPENVMLVDKAGDPDFVKILDFGIAKVPIGEVPSGGDPNKPITKAGMVFGTPEYMPPEQALGQNVDERADLYSLGVMLYEMLCGLRPFEGTSEVGMLGKQLASPAPPFADRTQDVAIHPDVEALALSLLAKDPAERPQDAQGVLDRIDELLGGRNRELLTLREGSTAPEADPTMLASEAAVGPLPPPPTLPAGLSADTRDSPSPAAARTLDALVDPYRSRLPRSLRDAPSAIIMAGPVAVVGLVIGIGSVLALGEDAVPEPGGPAPTASASASPLRPHVKAPSAAIEKALASGAGALVALAKEYPDDPAVSIAASGYYLSKKKYSTAVTEIETAIALDPSLSTDEQISSVLWTTAQKRESSQATIELLDGPMGERGQSILRDLTTTPGVKAHVKQRAAAALAK